MELIVQLVVWNGKKYLPYVFESLACQTYTDWHLLICDNNSTDGSAEWLAAHASENGVVSTLFTQSENLGFAGGHNFLFHKATEQFPESAYVLLLNQDMVLEPDCFAHLIQFALRHSDAGAIAPRLMRWDFDADGRTEIVDTLGLRVFSNRRVVDWMTGCTYTDEILVPYVKRRNDGAIEVFGVSGALPLYRVFALKKCLCAGQLFDAAYGSYKEDVDCAWRLRLSGYRAFTVLDAVAYHDRTAAGPRSLGDAAARANYQKKSDSVRFQSYRNHLLTLFKNELWQNALIDAPHIFWYELKKLTYLLTHYPPIAIRAWYDIITLTPQTWRKRREMIRYKKVDWFALRKWWNI